MDATTALGELLEAEHDRIARQWAKRLAAELGEQTASLHELKEPLARHVSELARLLKDRGEDALRLWPEHVRAHGAGRFVQGFDADDVVREFAVLQEVLLHRYARRRGAVDAPASVLIARLCGEATAAVMASFVRAVRTEEVRFREAATMESILHHVDMGILLAGRDGVVSYATPPAAALLGVPVRALLGEGGRESFRAVLRQVKARHPNHERFRWADMPFLRALAQRAPVRGVWMVFDRPSDGREVSVEISATPLFDEGSRELLGVLQTMADRTESALKTRELEDAYEALRRLQGRLLQRTRQQALGQLASSTAHALNNSLNVMKLRLTLLRRGYKPEHAEALERSMAGVGKLVARLQEFAVHRVEDAGGPVDSSTVLREGLESVRAELERGASPVRQEVSIDGAGQVRADETLLKELVVNLCLICKERMPQGGVLSVSAAPEAGWTAVTLTFGGAPFTPDELVQLFDPLKGTNGRMAQLSLLLAIGRSQVQHWGGELWCENGVGPSGGAIFHLRLPAAETAAEVPRPVSARPSPLRPERRRVLVVDDDADNARMMTDLLGEEGYDVASVPTSAEALRLWESRPFDAALLDALLQESSGWELARELRSRTPEALIAMVTGADVRGQSRQTLALVDAVFRKPVDVAALDEFLAQSRGRAASEPVAIH